MKLNQHAQAIIDRIEYATIASVDTEGHPWNAPVYYAYDQEYSFYWGSYKDAQHSKNIRTNPHIFILVYNSTVKPGTGEGVYIQARCSELTKLDEIALAHKLIENRRSPIPYWKQEQFTARDSPIRLYKAVPEHMWMNGDSHINGTYIDTRILAEES